MSYKKAKIHLIKNNDGKILKGLAVEGFKAPLILNRDASFEWERFGTECDIYFTNNESINEGDYFLSQSNGIFKCTNIVNGNVCFEINNKEAETSQRYINKIVASSDKSLPINKIPLNFVEKFCNSGYIISEILIEYEPDHSTIPEYEDEIIGDWRNYVTEKIKVNVNNEVSLMSAKESWNRNEVEALLFKFMNREGCNTFTSNYKQSLDDFINEYL